MPKEENHACSYVVLGGEARLFAASLALASASYMQGCCLVGIHYVASSAMRYPCDLAS
ncbi:uncharacterized protein BDW43DRAFT_287922 [Aspergillus alliaceus]|uniref:uncharacterized protein n=1 Tax=Petromyces alliaceus TaxID=209559 RepID=UPI0012A7353C|nr:uncharacterized protein BDW43DRAFT_287922 [Aspergillus alliaceus]KAB8229585.1 hypothetical protein BDW43DRAFT_287922 [Aspergillus alliaceus]